MPPKDFTIKFGDHGSKEFFHGVLGGLDNSFKAGIKQGLHQVGVNLVKTFRDGVQRQAKTGKIYFIAAKGGRDGKVKLRGKNKNRHQASAAGEYPAILTGAFIKGIDFNAIGSTELEFGNSDDKAVWLEKGTENKDGTQKMAPRKPLQNAINERRKDTYNILDNATRKRVDILHKDLLKGL